jgi:hypothetical protein
VGNEPDKQWITIDTNPQSPHYNRIYAMWVDFTGPFSAKPFVSFADANVDGTHTDWSAPQPLPLIPHTPQGASYLLPHVTPNGDVYTTLSNELPKKGFCCYQIFVDRSSDGGRNWSVAGTAATNIVPPPAIYPNTTFRDGIEDTFTVGNHLDSGGHYPLYLTYEDYSAGIGNVSLSASYDGGGTWSSPIRVNDNINPVDEFQPNLATAANGTVSVNFYDRRLACAVAGTPEASGAGLALDQVNPNYSGSLPPYGATNYCVNASIQFYTATLQPIGHNIRLTQYTWDPQLNAPHTSSPGGKRTFIGDYFGNVSSGPNEISTFVSTYDGGSNPAHRQQQVVAIVAVP